MAGTDLLAQLRDIHLPTAISAWPPAPGWFVVAGMFLVFVAAIMLYCWRRQVLAKRGRRLALQELQHIKQRFTQPNQAVLAMVELAVLVKRAALSYYPREQVASLHGERWLNFLASSGDMPEFLHGEARLIADAPYRHCKPDDPDHLCTLVETWLKKAC